VRGSIIGGYNIFVDLPPNLWWKATCVSNLMFLWLVPLGIVRGEGFGSVCYSCFVLLVVSFEKSSGFVVYVFVCVFFSCLNCSCFGRSFQTSNKLYTETLVSSLSRFDISHVGFVLAQAKPNGRVHKTRA
jgi:hypothetical protein